MSKKPHKAEEAATPYTAKQPVKADALMSKANESRQVRYANPEQARKAIEKVFQVHHELFRKLAK